MTQDAPPREISFHRPHFTEAEALGAAEALRSAKVSGDGTFTKAASAKLKELTGSRHVLLTTSCTHALELALMAIGVEAGDEVICPSFTFVSTANAIIRQGATPVFVEIDERTLNIDCADVEKRITERTKAIIPVHYGGVGCEMDALGDLARSAGIRVVEDAAQGLCARYRGRSLGAIGDVGCFSFHETKNVTCGEGGALLTDDDQLARRAEIIREKGTNRSAFLRGEVDKYTWVDEGSSFLPSDILAAVLLAQLEKVAEIHEARRRIYERYLDALGPLAASGTLALPHIPAHCDSNYHIFHVLMRDGPTRDFCLDELRKRGIRATFHYIPLHSSPYGREALGYQPSDLPVTEQVSARLLRLPIYPTLRQEEVERVVAAVLEILEGS